MNYLFYMGIIAPTLITIVLFVVFVYCWFLQKARKEVLTKKYDPHGKMRRLGIARDPPPPPPYCRVGSSERDTLYADAIDDDGEDNRAYDVSRSPSTEQDARGRPLYNTYHDSGISAGLSPSLETPMNAGGLSYRTCPDSGISGFSVQLGASSMPGLVAPPPPIHPQSLSLSQHQHQPQHHHHQQQIPCRGCYQAREQMPQAPHHNQQNVYPLRSPHQHQQHQEPVVMLHHNTVQASVHPTHGVCYGDDTTHPQSPQHYNPPPIQSIVSTMTVPHGVGPQSPTSTFMGGSRQFINTMPHIHEQPHQDDTNFHMGLHPLDNHNHENSGLCYCSNGPEHHQQLHQHQNENHQHRQELRIQLDQPYDPHGVNRVSKNKITNNSNSDMMAVGTFAQNDFLPDLNDQPPPPYPNTFRSPKHNNHRLSLPQPALSPQKDTKHIVENHNASNEQHVNPGQLDSPQACRPLPSTSSNSSSSSSSSSSKLQKQKHLRHSYRDSGVLLDVGQTPPTVSDRPDSQASTSSTTDSEDSGFRSSYCTANHHQGSKLNKQGNPLLKPLRRPKNLKNRPKSSRKGSSEDDLMVQGATPLSTLNPKNLQCQTAINTTNKPHVIQTTALLDNSVQGGGQHQKQYNQRQQQNIHQQPNSLHIVHQQRHSQYPNNIGVAPSATNIAVTSASTTLMPTLSSPGQGDYQNDNTVTSNSHSLSGDHTNMDGALNDQISTHLSWKYLQDLSVSSNSSQDTISNSGEGLQLMGKANNFQNAPSEQLDVFSYSIV